jgi:hypothetical protein
MQKAGKTVGRWLNHFIRSDGWKALQRASREIRNLPTTLMREANMDEFQALGNDLRQTIDPRPRPPTAPTSRSVAPSNPRGTIPPSTADNVDAPVGDEPDQP